MSTERTSILAVDDPCKLGDSISLFLGDGADREDPSVGDVQIRWDGTDLDILVAADDTVIKIGNGTLSADVWIYGNTADDYLEWDASAGRLYTRGAAGVTLAGTGGLTITDVNIALGTTTGTKIGTAASQKLGFYNATPVVQPTGVAVTAGGVHAALVTLGLITA